MATQRKGELLIMEPKGDLQHLEFEIPSRGLIGLRNNILTATAGEAVMTHRFKNYAQHKGELPTRKNGSLVSMENGQVSAYALDKLQDRVDFSLHRVIKSTKDRLLENIPDTMIWMSMLLKARN